MKTKLIHRGNGDYRLYVNEIPYATTENSPYKKLSKQNCDELFVVTQYDRTCLGCGRGFNFEEMNNRLSPCCNDGNYAGVLYESPTEIEVEIVMECLVSGSFQIIDFSTDPPKTSDKIDLPCVEDTPKLDSSGNLILKKK
jgi:hypothetical protein